MSSAIHADPMPAVSSDTDSTVARQLRLAYLTTEYPKVSHTFIRREILELERRGHHVQRIAIRPAVAAIADPIDIQEETRTFHCLSQSPWKFLWAITCAKVCHPIRWLGALRMAISMSRRSDRGLITHLAYLAEAAVLLRLLKRERIQHVHVHFGTNAAAVARLVRRLGGPPYSMTVHGPDEFDSPRGFSLAEKIADAAFVIAISDFCAAQLRRWGEPEHWNKIHIVRCTVGEEFFGGFQPITASCKVLLSVGRLSAQKGQLVLIEAFKQAIDAGMDGELVLAGDGEMRQTIERAIAQFGLGRRGRISGWVDEEAVRQYLRSARVLVQPSFAEGLPVVMMEALAMGRPVIATTIAGVPELVRDGENGWLVPAGNVAELATAMRRAMIAPINVLNEMGAAGRERVRKHHLTSTEVDRLEALFLAQCAEPD